MIPSSTTCRPSPRSMPVTYTLRVTRALRLFVWSIDPVGMGCPLDNTSANG